jgi:DNA end-binding protein Ku
MKKESPEASTRPFWSGTITFGLVSVPVELYPATRKSRAGLRMLSADGEPLRRRYFSGKTDRELADKETVMGYEFKRGKFVVVTDEELEKLQPEKTRDINLERFVDAASIPPLFFDHPYFLAPAGSSVKSYRLLAAVMEKTGQAGIATFVMRGKAYLVAIFSEKNVLRACTLRFADEVRSATDIGLPKRQEPKPAAVRKFARTIQSRSRKTLVALHDEQSVQLERYAKKKMARHKDVVESDAAEAQPEAAAVDIMAILKKSLEKKGRRAA